MNQPNATIHVNVDPANPGQFFACCGLLELADRLWGGAEGWFEPGDYCLACGGSIERALEALLKHEAEEVTRLEDLEVKRLFAPLRITLDGAARSNLLLDAWMTVRLDRGQPLAAANPPWNFWSGQQTSSRIWTSLREALIAQLETLPAGYEPGIFSHLVPLSGRFGFDPGAAWNALDTGFSPNEQNVAVASSPAVELLAAVGLQRFRPQLCDDRSTFIYSTWGQPLAPTVAAAAMSGVISVPPAVRLRGRVVSRGSYAALGYSTLISRSEA